MRIKMLKGVAGEWKGRGFHFSRGFEGEIDDFLAVDLIRGGNAKAIRDVEIPPPEAKAIVPIVTRVIKTTIKRGRPKNV